MSSICPIADPAPLKGVLEAIFISDDPFGWPFSSAMQARMLFYPTEGYHLAEDQYDAVADATRMMGDEGFVVSIIEGQGEWIERGEHWWCEFPTYEEYLELPLVLENVVYSKSGKWGIMISHEDHAVIAGTTEFIDKVREQYTDWPHDLESLKEAWEGNPNASWIESMLAE